MTSADRRRSGRAHKVSDYKERDDADDEEEMLEGVAEWDYGEDDSDAEESGSDEGSEQSDDADSGNEEAEEGEDEEEEEGEREEATAKRNGSRAASSPKGKDSVKASVLAKLGRTSRARSRGGRATKDDSEMDVDE
jgi:sister-chromatid-cohesion protein PDS5